VDVDRLMTRLNPAVAWVLRSRLHPLLSAGLMLITVTGRRTRRRYTIPVGYQRDGTVLTVLVSRASRKQWWRNLRAAAPVEVRVRGRMLTGVARVVPAESKEFSDAIDATFRRMPGLGRQFGIEYDRERGLTEEQWRRVGEDGAVVKVELIDEPKR
jgi:deazaflavin-dependent oxidoreductase (nitroreductase family)